jgi:aminopeptidase N
MKSGATEEANRARKAEREATDKRYLDTIVDEKLKESILTVRQHAITMPIEKIGQLIKRIGEMRTTHKSALDIYRALAREFHPDRPKTASEELMQLLSLIYDTKEKKFWHDRQSESAAA